MTNIKKPTPTRIVQFQASDSTLHATYAAAIKHEHGIELAMWLDNWMDERGWADDGPSGTQLSDAIKGSWSVSRRKK
jgi:hypothetical protein